MGYICHFLSNFCCYILVFERTRSIHLFSYENSLLYSVPFFFPQILTVFPIIVNRFCLPSRCGLFVNLRATKIANTVRFANLNRGLYFFFYFVTRWVWTPDLKILIGAIKNETIKRFLMVRATKAILWECHRYYTLLQTQSSNAEHGKFTWGFDFFSLYYSYLISFVIAMMGYDVSVICR